MYLGRRRSTHLPGAHPEPDSWVASAVPPRDRSRWAGPQGALPRKHGVLCAGRLEEHLNDLGRVQNSVPVGKGWRQCPAWLGCVCLSCLPWGGGRRQREERQISRRQEAQTTQSPVGLKVGVARGAGQDAGEICGPVARHEECSAGGNRKQSGFLLPPHISCREGGLLT